MTTTDAVGFLDRVEGDKHFARELETLADDPNAVYEKVKAAGFDAQPEEIREAFVDRYGAELTPEQLDQIAGGMSGDEMYAIAGVGAGLAVSVAFVAAAV
jgi:predicted ribosomally synthesized peptide with nif11-like leader